MQNELGSCNRKNNRIFIFLINTALHQLILFFISNLTLSITVGRAVFSRCSAILVKHESIKERKDTTNLQGCSRNKLLPVHCEATRLPARPLKPDSEL